MPGAGEKAPTDADPRGEWYAFEKGAMKTAGGDGWADVWKRGCFAWEYKSPGKDLNAALKQLQYYVRSLENPPLLIVSDMERIELHTNWTNTVQEVHTLSLPELADARRRQLLKKAFSETEVEELKPGKTREALTKEVAEEFVKLAQNLRDRGHDPEKVAHFVNRMVFCMFAEDVDLLPDRLFKRMLEASLEEPESFAENAQKLFAAMAKEGGRLDFKRIEWFNGGIFDDDSALPLTKEDIKTALAAANRNWSNIDPSIMGTLFERGLDPGKRSQLGAHYTDPDKIMLIVNPVIVEPLTREWEEIRSKIEAELETATAAREARPKLLGHKAAIEAHLSRRAGELFAVDNEVLLYDVTSRYFEGQAEANPLAQRGYSRDHRSDCKQVLIALVVTFDGFPLGYEVLAGNTHDSKTVQTIVTAMEARHGAVGRVWIADRGMASRDNLAWLRSTGRRYIIGAPKSDHSA